MYGAGAGSARCATARQALRREAGLAGHRLRAPARRIPRRHRPQRLREDDAAADLCRARATDRGDDRAERDAGAARLSRPRVARLSRADGAREPRPLRAPVPPGRAARADRDGARALRALGGPAPERRVLLPRHDAAAGALPRPPPRAGAARPRRALQRARRGRSRAARRATGRAPRRADLPAGDPRSGARRIARDRAPRPRGMSYVRDVGALARKDLLLELRARDTLPAMLLFVAAVFVVFHFTLPGSPSRLETSGLLWVAILFTALLGLGRAFVPEREQRTLDGLVLAPCDRSAIWLAKSLATLAFLAAAEVVALPLYALFFHRVGGATVAAVVLADLGICAVGTFLGAMAVATRARDLILPLLFLPLAIPIVVGAVGATVVASPGRYLGFLALYDALFAVICWASFEY